MKAKVTAAVVEPLQQACRITLKYGKSIKSHVLTAGPVPKVGDVVRFKGQGAEWTVTKVKPLDPAKTFSISFKKVAKPGSAL